MSPRYDFTIVTSTFNCVEILPSCMASARSESASIQHLIIDGGSTDGTVDLLRTQHHPHVQWLSGPDRGIYDAWNKAIPLIQGGYVIFLGADDRLEPGALEAVQDWLSVRAENPLTIYGKAHLRRENGEIIRTMNRPWEEIGPSFGNLPREMCHQAVLVRREAFERYGAFDASFRIAGDYEWLLRSVTKDRPVFIPHLVVASQTVGGVSQRISRNLEMLSEFRRAQARHGYPLSRELRTAYVKAGLRLLLLKSGIVNDQWVTDRAARKNRQEGLS